MKKIGKAKDKTYNSIKLDEFSKVSKNNKTDLVILSKDDTQNTKK